MAFSAITRIPTPPPMFYDVDAEEQEYQKGEQKQRLWDWLRKLRRDEPTTPIHDIQKLNTPPQTPARASFGRRFSRKVGVGIPRSTTFRRQEDEQRKNLEPVKPLIKERKAVSQVRQRALSAQPKPLPSKKPRRETSAPHLGYHYDAYPSIDACVNAHDLVDLSGGQDEHTPPPPPPPPRPPPPDLHPDLNDDAASRASYETSHTLDEEILNELEKKWILNLSMHFKDKSPREKFFITYAETPQRWRRVTVSCDYRDAEIDSLESDLQMRDSQREKSARIYESLRGSLGEIQFYDTITNLKLETRDERLHVHVTEDVNEIISYPSIRSINHLQHVRRYKESELHFQEHMSGFVYKVDVGGKTWIKKEITGPDSVDEFLYEINALSNLMHAENVIELKGLVLDEDEATVKGLLVAYAEKNALVDIIYDNQGNLPWRRRERWARQIVNGLSELHEAGFVQGDFTLSNIVIDSDDEAQIIDINRRGCPVGWEPPEIARLIENEQRISMFIGVKSDLFQLGMVLWALAMEEDEPDRKRPLSLDDAPAEIPGYFHALVAKCLDPDPAMRLSAADLLKDFPESAFESLPLESLAELNTCHIPSSAIVTGNPNRADVQLAEDTDASVGAEFTTAAPSHHHHHPLPDISRTKDMPSPPPKAIEREYRQGGDIPTLDVEQPKQPSSMLADTSSTDQETSRALLRSSEVFPNLHSANIAPSPDGRTSAEVVEGVGEPEAPEEPEEPDEPQTIQISPTGEPSWEEVTMGGTPYLIHRDTLDSLDDEDLSSRQPQAHHSPRRFFHRINAAPLLFGRDFQHVDSGLGDMDLAGIGGHENLSFAARTHASNIGKEYDTAIEDEVQEGPNTEIREGTTDDLFKSEMAIQGGTTEDLPATDLSTQKEENDKIVEPDDPGEPDETGTADQVDTAEHRHDHGNDITNDRYDDYKPADSTTTGN
ncbi:MAG: hypothetical protein Q9164_002729 [Protoblastenia rupestris]